jgi:hypothetical protein
MEGTPSSSQMKDEKIINGAAGWDWKIEKIENVRITMSYVKRR